MSASSSMIGGHSSFQASIDHAATAYIESLMDMDEQRKRGITTSYKTDEVDSQHLPPLKKLKSRHDVNDSPSLTEVAPFTSYTLQSSGQGNMQMMAMIQSFVTEDDFETALDLLRMSPDYCTATFDNAPDVDIDPAPVNAVSNQMMAIQAIANEMVIRRQQLYELENRLAAAVYTENVPTAESMYQRALAFLEMGTIETLALARELKQ